MSKCIKVSYHNRYDEEINILCPHIKEIKTCKIVCKSRFSDFVILEFNSNKKRDEYIYNFCSFNCWQGCKMSILNNGDS